MRFYEFYFVFEYSLKELLARKGIWFSNILFGVSLCVLFSFALGPELSANARVSNGVFWAISECVIALSLGHLYTAENESHMFEVILASGIKPINIFFGKCIFTTFQTLSLITPICMIWALLFNIKNALNIFHLFLILFPLFSLSAAIIGTLISSLTHSNPLKELMFSIIFFPLQLITILCCVQLTNFTSNTSDFIVINSNPWWTILISFPIIFLLLGFLLSHFMFQDQ